MPADTAEAFRAFLAQRVGEAVFIGYLFRGEDDGVVGIVESVADGVVQLRTLREPRRVHLVALDAVTRVQEVDQHARRNRTQAHA